MKYYKFVGSERSAIGYGHGKFRPKVAMIYPSNVVFGGSSVETWATDTIFPEIMKEWEEVSYMEYFDQMIPPAPKVVIDSGKVDPTSPNHYKGGKVECWDAIESACIGKTGIEAYYVGNIIKYLWRYENKGGAVDISKALVYINKLIELKDENNR